MSKRRKKGYGFISEKDGEYLCHCYIGRLPNGNAKYHVLPKRFSNKAEAEAALIHAHDERIAEQSDGPLFDTWLTEYIEKLQAHAMLPAEQISHISPAYFRSVLSTINTALRPMKNADITYHGYVPLAQMRVNRITTDIVQGLANHLAFERGLSVSTIKKVVDCIRIVYEQHPQYSNPANASLQIEGKQQKSNRVPSEKQMNTLLPFLHSEAVNKKEAAAVLCAIQTGMRLSEICGLQWRDICTENGQQLVSVSRQICSTKLPGQKAAYSLTLPKTEKGNRVIPVGAFSQWLTPVIMLTFSTRRAISVLSEEYAKQPYAEDFVFGKTLNGVSVPMRPDHLSDYFQKFQKRVLPDAVPYTFHDLRNYYIKTQFRNGLSAIEIARLVGHASVQTTYRHYQASLDEEGAVQLSKKMRIGILNDPDKPEAVLLKEATDQAHPYSSAEEEIRESLCKYYVAYVTKAELKREDNRLSGDIAQMYFEEWASMTFHSYLWTKFWQEDCRKRLLTTKADDLLAGYKDGMDNFNYSALDPYTVNPQYIRQSYYCGMLRKDIE